MSLEKFSDIFEFLKKEKLKELLHDRKVLYAIVAGIAVFIFLVWLIVHFSFSGRGKASPLDAVPSDAAMILEIKQPKELWSELSVNSGVWRELSNIEFFGRINKEIYFLDSLFKTSECATAIITDHPVYISFHQLVNNIPGFLYLTALTKNCSKATVDELVKQTATSKATITEHSFKGADIMEVSLPGKKEKFDYTVSKDVFMCSFQPALLESAIMQQRSGTTVAMNTGFTKVAETAGKKVDADIYINFKYFPQFISSLSSREYIKKLMGLTGFADWSALDVSVKKDVILLNGFTSVSDTAANFLGLFADQEPHPMSMLNIIPSSSASFVYFGFSDFDKWYKLYTQYLNKKGKLKEHNAKIASIKAKYNTDIEKNFLTWIGKEIALVITEPSDSDITSNMFAVIKTDNIANALTLLDGKPIVQTQNVSSKSDSKNKKQKTKKGKDKHHVTKQTVTVEKEVEVGGNKIYEYQIPDVLSTLFGDLFDGIEGKFYTVVNDYIIIGNSSKAISSFLQDYADEKTLSDNNNYNSFSKNISNEANIYLYCNIKKSLGIILKYADKGIYNYIANNLSSFKNFDAFAYQLKSSGKLFYNNICLKTNTTVVEESSALWTVKLDTTVYSKPQIVADNSDKSKKIIAFDNASNIYFISKEGTVLWKIKLKEKPISDVFVIDYFKNGKSEYMFNTPSYIYLIDKDGKNVDNFPVHLSDESTAPMTVADYANDKEYRLIVPCGNKIYNYTKNGIINKGWTIVKTKSTLCKEATYLKFDGTDCFVTSDKDGNIYVFDRKGTNKINLKTAVTAGSFSKFYLTKADKKSKANILTTDNSGKLLFISSSGVTEEKTIAQFSPSHFFFYDDVNNDNSNEYIFLDNNKLSVYNSELKQLYSYTVPSDISTYPVIFKETGNKGSIGLVSSKANKIYLVKPDGTLSDGFPLNGSTPFAIAGLNNDGSLNLIVGSDCTIYNYSFE